MSFYDYLNPEEEVKHKFEIRVEDPSKMKEVVGMTKKRVFHFQQLKGYDRIYRDIPLSKVKYLETVWHGYNIKLLVVAIILFIIGIVFVTNLWFVSIGVFIFAIILLVKALKNYGYFLINNDDWKFHFKRRDDLKLVEQIIQDIYYLQSE